jgi:hypothetical protein
MHAITTTTRGLSVLVTINKDRVAGLAVVAAALLAGAWIASLGLR